MTGSSLSSTACLKEKPAFPKGLPFPPTPPREHGWSLCLSFAPKLQLQEQGWAEWRILRNSELQGTLSPLPVHGVTQKHTTGGASGFLRRGGCVQLRGLHREIHQEMGRIHQEMGRIHQQSTSSPALCLSCQTQPVAPDTPVTLRNTPDKGRQ